MYAEHTLILIVERKLHMAFKWLSKRFTYGIVKEEKEHKEKQLLMMKTQYLLLFN